MAWSAEVRCWKIAAMREGGAAVLRGAAARELTWLQIPPTTTSTTCAGCSASVLRDRGHGRARAACRWLESLLVQWFDPSYARIGLLGTLRPCHCDAGAHVVIRVTRGSGMTGTSRPCHVDLVFGWLLRLRLRCFSLVASLYSCVVVSHHFLPRHSFGRMYRLFMYSDVADITACWHFAFLCEFSLFSETTLVNFSGFAFGAPW